MTYNRYIWQQQSAKVKRKMWCILTNERVIIPSTAATEGVQFHLVEVNRKDLALNDWESKWGYGNRARAGSKVPIPYKTMRKAETVGTTGRWTHSICYAPVYIKKSTPNHSTWDGFNKIVDRKKWTELFPLLQFIDNGLVINTMTQLVRDQQNLWKPFTTRRPKIIFKRFCSFNFQPDFYFLSTLNCSARGS